MKTPEEWDAVEGYIADLHAINLGHEAAVADLRAELTRLRAFHQDPVEIARLREKVVLAQNVALAWGDGNNDRLQAALLSLFLNLYGQAPRNAVEETT